MKSGKSKKPRQTLRPSPIELWGRRREEGRPRGTLKIYPFEQTRLGFLLKYEAPLVYDLLWELVPRGRKKAPPAEVIRAVCAASDDPTFRKPKFFRYLAEYENEGLCCRRPKLPTPERMVYYYRIRRRKMEKYLEAITTERSDILDYKKHTTDDNPGRVCKDKE